MPAKEGASGGCSKPRGAAATTAAALVPTRHVTVALCHSHTCQRSCHMTLPALPTAPSSTRRAINERGACSDQCANVVIGPLLLLLLLTRTWLRENDQSEHGVGWQQAASGGARLDESRCLRPPCCRPCAPQRHRPRDGTGPGRHGAVAAGCIRAAPRGVVPFVTGCDVPLRALGG